MNQVSQSTARSTPRPSSGPHRLALAALLLLVAAVFWRALFTSGVFFYRDVMYAHFPRMVALRELVHGGWPPFWNPLEHFGEPAAANANYLVFYPTAWLAWILPAAYGFKLHFVLHFFLLAAGSFFLARRIGLGAPACFLAGALFVFSGPIMSQGSFFNALPAAAWICPALLAADYQSRRGGIAGALLFGAAIALQLFAGEPMTSAFTVVLALGWVLARHGDFGRAFNRHNVVLFGQLAGGAGLGLLLAAVQLGPAILHARLTERAASLSYQQSLFGSVHPLKLLEVLLPEFWGHAIYDPSPWSFLDNRQDPYLTSLFIGLIPLALAFAAVILARRPQPAQPSSLPSPGAGRVAGFWAVVAVAALLLALGSYTPLSYVLYDVLPLYRAVRFPAKLMIPFSLAVAQLAALAFDTLVRRPASDVPKRRARLLRAGAYQMIAFGVAWLALTAIAAVRPAWIAGPASRFAASALAHAQQDSGIPQLVTPNRSAVIENAGTWVVKAIPREAALVLYSSLLSALLLFLAARRDQGQARRRVLLIAAGAAVAQLVSAHYGTNPVVSARLLGDRPAAAALLQASDHSQPVRVFTEPLEPQSLPAPVYALDLAQLDFLPPYAQAAYSNRMSLQADTALLGLENTFTADPEHFLPRPQEALNNLVSRQGLRGDALVRVLRASSVEYAVLRRYEAAPGLAPVGTAPNGTTQAVRVYRVTATQPRAYAVGNATALPDAPNVIRRMLSPEFDPSREVLLESAGSPAGAAQPASVTSRVTLLSRNATRTEIDVEAPQAVFVVLTDSYNPGWKVAVDGAAGKLLRANAMFRAVQVPAGRHRVVFRYRPDALYWGFAVSAATLVLALLAVAFRRRAEG